jgi:chloramphenicol-sensitive protein RarD
MSAIDPPVNAAGLSEAQKGVIFGLCAHLVWGVMGYYFYLMRDVSPAEMAVHRGLWALPIAAVVVLIAGQWSDVVRALKSPRIVATLAFTSFLIVFNWGFYIWCIQNGRTTEASLGYYINPLLNVVAGALFLGERFTRTQLVAIGLAIIAVAIQAVAVGVVPWIGLMLGLTFCIYGYIRKTVNVGATQGFLIETLIILAPALGVAFWFAETGQAAFLTTWRATLMLMGCGVLTAAALLFFSAAVRRIRYSTAGLMQYISPTIVFFTAIFVFGETMDGWKLLSFIILWIALAIYSLATLRDSRARRPEAEEPAQA